jgi:hypothetical protein
MTTIANFYNYGVGYGVGSVLPGNDRQLAHSILDGAHCLDRVQDQID